MNRQRDDNGCGCIFMLLLLMGGCVIYSCEKRANKRIKEDYSSPPSEMGEFTPYLDYGVNARDFTVRNGVGYLTLNNGEVIKMKRTGDGKYSGLNYTAVKTFNGYQITKH